MEGISEKYYQGCPQGLKDWIQELGWHRTEISSINIKYEIIPDAKSYKQGNSVEVTVIRDDVVKVQQFARNGPGDWTKK